MKYFIRYNDYKKQLSLAFWHKSIWLLIAAIVFMIGVVVAFCWVQTTLTIALVYVAAFVCAIAIGWCSIGYALLVVRYVSQFAAQHPTGVAEIYLTIGEEIVFQDVSTRFQSRWEREKCRIYKSSNYLIIKTHRYIPILVPKTNYHGKGID